MITISIKGYKKLHSQFQNFLKEIELKNWNWIYQSRNNLNLRLQDERKLVCDMFSDNKSFFISNYPYPLSTALNEINFILQAVLSFFQWFSYEFIWIFSIWKALAALRSKTWVSLLTFAFIIKMFVCIINFK